MPVYKVEVEARPGLPDPLASHTCDRLENWLGLRPKRVATRQIYRLDLAITGAEAEAVAAALVDPVAEIGTLGNLPDPEGAAILTVGFRPGVTDTLGKTVKTAAEDCLGRSLSGEVYSAKAYLIWGLDRPELERAASELLYNPLIETVDIQACPRRGELPLPRAGGEQVVATRIVPLREASPERLLEISQNGMLALDLREMSAIAAHFRELGRDPSDAELECLAQTWSEHCKHKIFAASIEYVDPAGQVSQIDGLFKTYVRGTTLAVQTSHLEPDFLVSVFDDNAGVVAFTEADHLVYKVETHNSPSALDPYGGAMTGIVGVNRDSFGTGLGADLLTNVWGYCFADPAWQAELPPGLMHPRRIRDGVHRGVIEGGNHCGIPYSRGFELFEDCYLGKPLVFCGTVAVMPVQVAGRPTQHKVARPGDKIVMVGGRIGKDGIHGATFSSRELDESSPVQAVQIGDPITQKMMFDMLTCARDMGLLRSMTDNGAGGLSSSVGELAQSTGGARIDLALAPLKYPGLAPWEILVSEAQERMTVGVAPEDLEAFLQLAKRREVEATVLGEFTDTGKFEVFHGADKIVDLRLEFLHGGCPRLQLRARWSPPPRELLSREQALAKLQSCPLEDLVLALLARPNLASDEERCRHYDHEVKGLSVVKPWVGVKRDVPAPATVMRARHGRDEGVVLGEGIHPHYSEIDTFAMAQACVDEALRKVLCAGARLDRLAALDNFCWPDPIQSDKTPDGEHKLAQLVRCCQGLQQACLAYGVPLISGKDSMKNDAVFAGKKISILPTLLVSMIGQMPDVRRVIGMAPLSPGEHLFLLGPTESELGGSEALRHVHGFSREVPRCDLAANMARYRRFEKSRDAGLVRFAHVPSRGGLAKALADLTLASELGIEVDLAAVHPDPQVAACSESQGRIVLGCTPDARNALIEALGTECKEIGRVLPAGREGLLRLRRGDENLCELTSSRLRQSSARGFHGR